MTFPPDEIIPKHIFKPKRKFLIITDHLNNRWVGCKHGEKADSREPPLLCESCYHAIRKAAKEEEEF